MRTMHLFAGAGGGLLADLILGHTPVCAVEINPYCCEVLRERRDDGWFPDLHVWEGDVRVFPASEWAGRVDCIHAGFPCQDISYAGQGAGINGAKSGLWKEVVRVASVVRPRFIFLENSPAIVSRGIGGVLGDLDALGYDARWCVLSASAVGSAQRRERWWCLANANMLRELQPQGCEQEERGWSEDPPCCSSGTRLQRRSRKELESESITESTRQASARRSSGKESASTGSSDADWWSVESDVVRMVHGVAYRAHRIECLGNGQVPLCAAAAWEFLMTEVR